MGILEPDERHRRGAGAFRLRRKASAPKTGARLRKAVVIHSLDHALAAMRAAQTARVPLVLMSGRGAAGYAGPAWFAEVVAEAQARHPRVAATAILDCAEAPGRALAALRRGVKVLRLAGNPAARARVGEIAKKLGARLDDARYAVLDLGAVKNADRAAVEFLTSSSPLAPPSPPKTGGRGMRRVGAAKPAPYPKLGEGGDGPVSRKPRRKP